MTHVFNILNTGSEKNQWSFLFFSQKSAIGPVVTSRRSGSEFIQNMVSHWSTINGRFTIICNLFRATLCDHSKIILKLRKMSATLCCKKGAGSAQSVTLLHFVPLCTGICCSTKCLQEKGHDTRGNLWRHGQDNCWWAAFVFHNKMRVAGSKRGRESIEDDPVRPPQNVNNRCLSGEHSLQSFGRQTFINSADGQFSSKC
jgi:hypothetical protein